MNIETIPAEVEDLLYEWQKAEIIKKIKAPILAIDHKDPAWHELDDMMTASNNILNLEKAGETQLTIHELLPGVHAAWLVDDYSYSDPSDSAGEFILISAADLAIIRDAGYSGLVQSILFKSF